MSNLDDFFAKKDKKKKKGFSKANADVIAKNLEESDRKEQKADEKAGGMLMATTEAAKLALADEPDGRRPDSQLDPGVRGANDDDWLDYDNQKKDFSGLKIDTLKISKDGDEDDDDEEHEINDEGEKVRVKKGDGGVWNKSTKHKNADNDSESEDSSDRSPAPVKKTAPTDASSSSGTKSSYVPPHLRNAPASGGPALNPIRLGGGGGGGNRRNRMAPDINSEVYFPSLSAANAGGGEDDKNRGRDVDFEEVRSGGHQMSSRNTEAPRLALDNKFSALRDN